MSVIDEALKKTQSALNLNSQPTNEDSIAQPKPQFQSSFISPRNEFHFDFITPWTISLSIATILFVAVFCFHGFLENIVTKDFHFYRNLFHHTAIVEPQLKIPEPAATPIAPPISSYVLTLNGTMQVNNQRVALINHELYDVGQMIDGLQIKQINYSNVLLENPKTHEKRVLTPDLTR